VKWAEIRFKSGQVEFTWVRALNEIKLQSLTNSGLKSATKLVKHGLKRRREDPY
jgi:hypothetical protein